MALAQEAADAGDADVVGLGPHGLAARVVGHRAQLVDQERLAALADPLLAKEHGPAVPLDEERRDAHDRRQDDRRGNGHGEVEARLSARVSGL